MFSQSCSRKTTYSSACKLNAKGTFPRLRCWSHRALPLLRAGLAGVRPPRAGAVGPSWALGDPAQRWSGCCSPGAVLGTRGLCRGTCPWLAGSYPGSKGSGCCADGKGDTHKNECGEAVRDFSPKGSWPWLLLPATAYLLDSFSPKPSASWFSIRHVRAGSS